MTKYFVSNEAESNRLFNHSERIQLLTRTSKKSEENNKRR